MPTRMIERSAQGRNTPCDVGVAKTAPLRVPYIYIYTYTYIYIYMYIDAYASTYAWTYAYTCT